MNLFNQHSQPCFPAAEKGRLFDSLGAAPDSQCWLFSNSFEAYFHLYYATYMDIMRECGRNHILTTFFEPSHSFHAIKKVEPLGCLSKILSLNVQGQVTSKKLEEAIGPRTALVSLTWANAFTGVIHPIEEIAAICKQKGVLLHVDATHLFGKHYFRFQDLDVDLLTLSLGGKTLLLKKRQTPLHFFPSINMDYASLLDIVEETLNRFDHFCTETVRLLTKLERGILSGLPGSSLLFQNAERLPNCMALAIPGVSGQALAFLLHRKGIQVSTGGEGAYHLSQILIKCGIDPKWAFASISIAIGYETQEAHIDRAIELIVATANKLRGYSYDL